MSKFTLLVADNFEGARIGYKLMLTGKGYEVLLAGSRREARDLLKEHLIHLALIDVRLEKDDNENDRSGLELCKEIDPIVPRILISGFKDWAVIREALRPHSIGTRKQLADGFFFKGFGEDEQEDTSLFKEIERILAEEYEVVPKSRIAVLTSGGDSPGMNAAVWSVVRTALRNEIEVLGVMDGYDGLISGDMRKLRWNDVSDIMIESGTILGSARSDDFFTETGRAAAVDNILSKHVSGLVVIGGDGSMSGAKALAEDVRNRNGDLKTVALPGTIDNDLVGTDMSLGAASAANAMVNQVRQLIRPAKALRMVFIVEVMGALSGYLALQTAIGSGADGVLLPEKILAFNPFPVDGPQEERIDFNATKANLDACIQEIEQQLRLAFASGKNYGFVIQAEGIDKATSEYVEGVRSEMSRNSTVGAGGGLPNNPTTIERLNGAYTKRILDERINQWDGIKPPKVRVQELGHAVRGVLPSRFDIWLGAVLGENAVKSLIAEQSEVMIGWTEKDGITRTSFDDVVRLSNRLPHEIWADRSSWRDLNDLHRALNYKTRAEEKTGS